MSDDWKNDRAEGAMHEYEAKRMAESAEKFKKELIEKTHFKVFNDNQPDEVVDIIKTKLASFGLTINQLDGGEGFEEYEIIKK